MANRHWVLSTGTWDPTSTTHWSATSGGAPGASVPTSSDNVYFDENSGGGSISTNTNNPPPSCLNFDCTGFTGNFVTNSTIRVSGSVVLGSGVTIANTISMIGSGVTLTTNGVVLPSLGVLTAGTVTLLDSLSCTSSINIRRSGLVDFNDFDVTSGTLLVNDVDAKQEAHLDLGTGTLTLTGTGNVFDVPDLTSLLAASSTIKLTNNSTSSKTFDGEGFTYGTLWIATQNTGITTIAGSNTFATLKADAGRDVRFTPGTTQTVNAFDAVGTSGNTIKLLSSGVGTWSLSKASGTVDCDYIEISDSVATGGATWNAGANSIDNGNNTGWNFNAPASAGHRMFMVF